MSMARIIAAAIAPPILPSMIAHGVPVFWFSCPCSSDGESVAAGAPVNLVSVDEDDGGAAVDEEMIVD